MTRKHHWLRSFVVIYIGQTFSIVGSAAVQFAILWYLTIKTGSANTLALASVAGLLPQALLGIFAGVWVDRMSRKKVMIYADLFVALASGILGVLLLWGTTHLCILHHPFFPALLDRYSTARLCRRQFPCWFRRR